MFNLFVLEKLPRMVENLRTRSSEVLVNVKQSEVINVNFKDFCVISQVSFPHFDQLSVQ